VNLLSVSFKASECTSETFAGTRAREDNRAPLRRLLQSL